MPAFDNLEKIHGDSDDASKPKKKKNSPMTRERFHNSNRDDDFSYLTSYEGVRRIKDDYSGTDGA